MIIEKVIYTVLAGVGLLLCYENAEHCTRSGPVSQTAQVDPNFQDQQKIDLLRRGVEQLERMNHLTETGR